MKLPRGIAARVSVTAVVLMSIGGAVWGQVAGPDPVAFREGLMRNGNLRTSGTGEQFCWHAVGGTGEFLDAYEVYGDDRWLEEASKYYDFFIGKLHKDPDGYEGWIGDPIGDRGAELSTDEVVGDSLLCAPLARFAEIVMKDPKLQPKFGATAKRYLDLATRICWEKYNKRGCYYEDAAGWGSYHRYGKMIDMRAGRWVDTPSREISDNLNKHYRMGIVLLRLWRATGRPEYRERVVKVFGRAKTMFRYFPDEDRIVWNFWMPHGPYDLEGRAPKSWVAVHPSRAGYQAGEVNMFVEVYDSGLVFERSDLERMIRTNHWMHEGGKWRSADGTTEAGTLWSALARWDEQIRRQALSGQRSSRGRIARDYLAWCMKKAPGWKRLYVTDESKVHVVKVPLQPGRHLTMTVAIPDKVETANNDRIQLAVQTRQAGTLKIELLDAAGQKVLGTLSEIQVGGTSEYNAPYWDGTNPQTGKKDVGTYMVRWTLGSESRQAPVVVTVGRKRAGAGPEPLVAGQTLTLDFEKPLQMARWTLESSGPSGDQKHGGSKSLKVGAECRFVFGQYDALPVKVSMWVYDGGAKLGQQSGNGPGWGVVTAVGDKFVLRQCWRPYLAGDTQYAWVNTGENQWFNPHPAGVSRKAGWSKWVFDFSNPSAVKVTCNGSPVQGLNPKFTPTGAVALYFVGGSGGPLYVDDVTIEYPKE